jgi:hypothetical protein
LAARFAPINSGPAISAFRIPTDQPEESDGAVQMALNGNAEICFVSYSRKQALQQAEQFVARGVTWFEKPVSSDDRVGLHLLVERAPACMKIAAGEYCYVLDDAQDLLSGGAVDVMQADATRCGGISNFI